MDDFEYRRGKLCCEGVRVEDVVRSCGTPAYIYSLATVLGHFRRLEEAFEGVDHQIFFAMKANSSLALLAALARRGCGFDIVSGGELHCLRRAGAGMSKVIFAGVGKTEAEIRAAIRARILMFNVESWPEALEINRLAVAMGREVQVDFRLNPDVDAHTHAHITTGTSGTKFGIPMSQAAEVFRRARGLKNIRVRGIHLHIGSQITQVGPYLEALRKAVKLIALLRRQGHVIDILNIGGGLGIIYDREKPATAADFARRVLPLVKGLGVKLFLEPGRFIVGNAGILATRVVYIKPAHGKTFVIVDSGMNDLIRPSLYQAFHRIIPLKQVKGPGKSALVDVVGPICESTDFLARNRRMALPRAGDLLAIRSAGAYGYTMASNYNSRPRAVEVLVSGKKWAVVRRRETQDDLVRGETIPGFVR